MWKADHRSGGGEAAMPCYHQLRNNTVAKVALPTSYLTSVKNLEAFLNALRTAKAPDKFTTKFLEALDFKSSSDRLLIGMLKSLSFLDGDGKPQDRYSRLLDQTNSSSVLGEALQDAYSDLFQINKNAQTLSKTDIVNKLKTLSQGQLSESVLDKIAMTFLALSKHADFAYRPKTEATREPLEAFGDEEGGDDAQHERASNQLHKSPKQRWSVGGLHYNIQIVLPESRDPKVYDALFRSLREHLGQ